MHRLYKLRPAIKLYVPHAANQVFRKNEGD